MSDLRNAIRTVLVEFLDWECVYPDTGVGSTDDAERDYDRLTEKLVEAVGAVGK